MSLSDLKDYCLESYESRLKQVAKPCLAGVVSECPTESFFGGMPVVGDDFVWPTKDGYPLHFIGQIQCADLRQFMPIPTGSLLFFYDNRHWGYRPKDRGHAVVLHDCGGRELDVSDLPICSVKVLFGLRTRQVSPKVYQRVYISFENAWSFPSLERELIDFEPVEDEEAYIDFRADRRPLVQIGGYPNPIHGDNIEADCVKAMGGQIKHWKLLLQLFELGDMVWGDAGALYWFSPIDDLKLGRYERVWMVSQCH